MSSSFSWMKAGVVLAGQPLGHRERREAVLAVELVEAEAERADDPEAAAARHDADRRQRAFGAEHAHRVADRHAQRLGGVLAEHDAVHLVFRVRNDLLDAARSHRAADIGDRRLERSDRSL